jgi:hypothetical protein
MFKWLFRLLLLVLLALGGWYVYQRFFGAGPSQALGLVPADAVMVFESRRPIAGWKEFSQSALWTHLRTHPAFAEIDAQARTLDSLIREHEVLLDIAGDRTLTFSLHLTSARDFDFFYALDLKEKQAQLLGEVLPPILRQFDPRLRTRQFEGYELIELHEAGDPSVLTVALVDNLLLASYTPRLVETALRQRTNSPWDSDTAFTQVRQLVDPSRFFNLYLRMDRLDDFARLYSDSQIDLLRQLGEVAPLAGLDFDTKADWTTLQGHFALRDSGTTYLHALHGVGAGERLAPRIASERTAVYLGLLFDDYLRVFDAFESQLRRSDPKQHADYRRQLDQVEGFLKIDIRKDLVSWFGREVALLTYPARKYSGRTSERLLLIHTRDRQLAEAGLGHILKQIRRRTPLKFKPLAYKDYTIQVLEVKGLFKLVLGKLFAKFERPYFAYVDDFVVFSNQLETLHDFLDDHAAGRTLDQQTEFKAVADRVSSRGQLFAYGASEPLMPLLSDFLSPATVADLKQNEAYARSFRAMGIRMASEPSGYGLELTLRYEAAQADSAGAEDELETQGLSEELASRLDAEGPYTETYANGKPRVRAYYRNGQLEGDYRSYWRNGNLMEQGEYRQGRKVGLWYRYSRSGRLEGKEDFGTPAE